MYKKLKKRLQKESSILMEFTPEMKEMIAYFVSMRQFILSYKLVKSEKDKQ